MTRIMRGALYIVRKTGSLSVARPIRPTTAFLLPLNTVLLLPVALRRRISLLHLRPEAPAVSTAPPGSGGALPPPHLALPNRPPPPPRRRPRRLAVPPAHRHHRRPGNHPHPSLYSLGTWSNPKPNPNPNPNRNPNGRLVGTGGGGSSAQGVAARRCNDGERCWSPSVRRHQQHLECGRARVEGRRKGESAPLMTYPRTNLKVED
ncbi:LOW QUALITY PROTEIN: hypothetical protein SETIT_9G164400v2 [Setaria italica]|uniref:Uncharacterized protein n=1 Tax=Setaria italica TaxID=4555 RepID=A0A368SH98_SETIT|nr:LOW QUALITY PROTEIN: hypothetical protein SETIT_9G164400v2 [Setaria italica]